jgi:cytochrome c oxidase subunit 3
VSVSESELALAHQFVDLDQQHDAATLGMWLFLVTEIMFFGGLFAGYAVYRSLYPAAFGQGSRLCDLTLGSINTAVLISSSLTMALAVRAAQLGRRARLIALLAATVLLGSLFLGIKFLEYSHKFHEHLIPGAAFQYPGPDSRQVQLFLCFYFGLTGLHALHMLIGIGVLLVPPHHAPALQSHRGRRPLLALRRHRLDLSVSLALPGGLTQMTRHIVSPKVYFLVFAALIVLTATTTAVATIDLGPLNVVAALTIAAVKATLVALFFMHLIHTPHRTKVILSAGVLWLIILISLTLSDILTRGWLPIPRPW